MHDVIYRALAEHLDRLLGGFAPSATGAEILLLRLIFTPRYADLAVQSCLSINTINGTETRLNSCSAHITS